MKKLLLIALLLPFQTQASQPVFMKDSLLPEAIQSKALTAIKSRCSPSLGDLKEVLTTAVEKTVDQDLEVDYRTVFAATYSLNGVTRLATAIVVESGEWEIMNPPNPEKNGISRVFSAYEGVCR